MNTGSSHTCLEMSKEITKYDRKLLRRLFVLLDRYENKMIRENIQKQIDEIKSKYK